MRAFLGSSLAVLALAVTFAQEPTFRSGTRVVPLPTMVTDSQGRFVPDLEQTDFTILDNGKPQEIVIFENSVQPFTVVVLLDFSASMTGHLKLLKEAAEEFLIRLLPVDKGMVGAFSSKIQFSGRFTNNRDALIGSLQDMQYGNETKLYDALDESIKLLEPIDGRRVILVLTDGEDFGSRMGQGTVRERAQKNDIMIYAIGFKSSIGGQVSNPDRDLRKLADSTGGGYFELKRSDELGPTFTRVAQELHSLYTIGFSPASLDNKEHKLLVRMKQPEHKARTRASYIATLED
jgi:Ca-activated chloride channel family protein